jgi:uncharacterized membrane protein
MATWKRDFGSGLVVLTPLLVTVIFLAWIYGYLARVPIPVESGPIRVSLTLVIFVLLVFSVGYLMRTAVGAVLERSLDDMMNHLPGLRVIYNASKMAVETALSGTSEFRRPVRLEVWDGLRMTAFKTGNKTEDGRDILFLPTAPNITTGFIVEADEDRYTEVEEDVEDALTRVLSAGFGSQDNDSELFGHRDANGGPEEVAISDVEGTAEAAAGAEGTDGNGADGAETTTESDASDPAEVTDTAPDDASGSASSEPS